jgi:hypothetical protein
MQSQYHNSPTINGIQQQPGRAYRAENVAYENRGRELRFQADVAGAYPEEAMVRNWYRTFSFKRGKSLTITEDFRLKKKLGSTSVNFMTSLIPEKGSDGQVMLKGDDFVLALEYNPKKTEVIIEEKHIEDSRLQNNWGKSVYRLVFSYRKEKISDQVEFVITGQ